MSYDPWRAAIIVDRKDAKYMDTGIQRLRAAGFEHIHVMVAKGVTVSKLYQPLSHQADEWVDGYSLWRGAIELLSQVYGARSDYFLITRPNFHFWGSLMQYCETTLDPRFIGVWSPFTPDRVFPSDPQPRPLCIGGTVDGVGKFGWCPTQINADASVADCMLLTGHMLTLVKEYLPLQSPGGTVGSAMALALARQRIPFYYHIPSLVTTEEHTFQASDFVGVTFDFPREEMSPAKRILEPVNKGRRKR
jgi:hypothetical protein